ncbi:hypothetical protein [Gracilibacillus boraciitolerans]|nr:hypothetical protein [Gracilibacillus boraciitolerans]
MTEWQPGQLEMKTPNKVERFLAKHNPYKKEAEAFFHAVETGDRSKILSDYEEAWHSFKVALAAEKSISEKRLVDMNEISE